MPSGRADPRGNPRAGWCAILGKWPALELPTLESGDCLLRPWAFVCLGVEAIVIDCEPTNVGVRPGCRASRCDAHRLAPSVRRRCRGRALPLHVDPDAGMTLASADPWSVRHPRHRATRPQPPRPAVIDPWALLSSAPHPFDRIRPLGASRGRDADTEGELAAASAHVVGFNLIRIAWLPEAHRCAHSGDGHARVHNRDRTASGQTPRERPQ